jgi:hypothetical protein
MGSLKTCFACIACSRKHGTRIRFSFIHRVIHSTWIIGYWATLGDEKPRR